MKVNEFDVGPVRLAHRKSFQNRRKFTVSEGFVEQIGRETDRRTLELRARRRISSNPLVQKNISFLQSYNALFGRPRLTQAGDADSIFRKSLRNYSQSLDIVRELRLDIGRKKTKQRSFLTKHHRPCPDHQRLFGTERTGSGDNREEVASTHESVQELFSKTSFDKQFESTSEGDLVLVSHIEDDREDQMAEEDFGGEDLENPNLFENAEDNEDDLKDVEEMIQQASKELAKVAEENQQMMEALEEDDEQDEVIAVTEPTGKEAAGDGSVFKFDPAIDAAVLRELEDAEKQAKATAVVIAELKDRVTQLLQKEKMTEAEAKELEQKNKELKDQMVLFEEKTKRIQCLLGQTNLFDKMTPIQPPLQAKHAEDALPKMLVCGVAENFIPTIVLCHDNKKKKSRPRSTSRDPMTRKLSDSYNMQERLVAENADLAGTRYKLQTDLIQKDRTVECLQRQLCCLQNELRMVCQQNNQLNNQMQSCTNPSCSKNVSRSSSPSGRKQGGGCGAGKGPCPGEVENRLEEYSQVTSNLEKQLVDVEKEVKVIQKELLEVQKEREHLEHHRRMLALQPLPCPASIPPPCPPHPCIVPPPCGHPPCYPPPQPPCVSPPPPCGQPPCPRPPPPCFPADGAGDDQQYREMKEKYSKLQEDFKAKLTEVSSLRAENEKLKEASKKAEDARAKLELKVKELEQKLKELRGGEKGSSKEQLIDLQQQIKVHKELYRQAQDELEELRALVEDLQGQLNDYRNKYLEAIQTVEEQKRQIDMMRMENSRVSEQVNLEILRVKNQFQEKLQELAPLPDILKATQLKLQEAQQMHLLAERNNEALARELQTYKDKLKEITDEMALADDDKASGANEKETLTKRVKELEEQLNECKSANDELKIERDKHKETAEEKERLADERQHQIVQLETQLEDVREDAARQVARIKDRCEIVRKSMQNQINDLERQLARAGAAAKAAERDRDDVRQKMQAQIRNLNENFEDAQMRIRNLQGHVNFLKTSYCTIPETTPSEKPKPKPDPCCCAD
ncbi:uncharacterized protein LOC143203901 isoform X1 [Rhynchophorus ferrugineus]|uniref:uncharacterized protein LOC143203901 isoform X1 n=1 Tax=Rhynchophorus ferrugineus TaxID=354439 RepID=UPI003FCC383A